MLFCKMQCKEHYINFLSFEKKKSCLLWQYYSLLQMIMINLRYRSKARNNLYHCLVCSPKFHKILFFRQHHPTNLNQNVMDNSLVISKLCLSLGPDMADHRYQGENVMELLAHCIGEDRYHLIK